METIGTHRRTTHEMAARKAIGEALQRIAEGLGSPATIYVTRLTGMPVPTPKLISIELEVIDNEYIAHVTIVEELSI